MDKNDEKKKKHYDWWPVVRNAVQAYPERKGKELFGVALHHQQAVQAAIEATERMEDGQKRLNVIRLVHWDRTQQILGAALLVPCSERTAYYWQQQFFEMVARNRDLLD